MIRRAMSPIISGSACGTNEDGLPGGDPQGHGRGRSCGEGGIVSKADSVPGISCGVLSGNNGGFDILFFELLDHGIGVGLFTKRSELKAVSYDGWRFGVQTCRGDRGCYRRIGWYARGVIGLCH